MIRRVRSIYRNSLYAARSLSQFSNAWMNPSAVTSALEHKEIDRVDLDVLERMLVTSLLSEDEEAVNNLKYRIQRFPQAEWHEDTFGNLIIAEAGDHNAILRLANPDSIGLWVKSWKDAGSEGYWVGGAGGGRAAPVINLLEAAISDLSAVSKPSPPESALNSVLVLYSNVLYFPSAAAAIARQPRVVELVVQAHSLIKHWRFISGGAAAGTEDAFVSSVVASTLTSLADGRPSPGGLPALSLVALLQADELKLGIQVYIEQVLPRRPTSAARQDLHTLLNCLLPAYMNDSQPCPRPSSWANGSDDEENAELYQRLGQHMQYRSQSQSQELVMQTHRLQAAAALCRAFLDVKCSESSEYAKETYLLERLLRIAGALHDADLMYNTLDECLTAGTPMSSTRKVIRASFLSLQDWLYSRELGPARIQVSSSELEQQPDVSVKRNTPSPAVQWEVGCREAQELRRRLCDTGLIASNNSHIQFTMQQADKLCGRYFLALLRDCTQRKQWRECERLLVAWLSEYTVGTLRPSALYLLTTSFLHLNEPLKALRLLEISHDQFGIKPDTDSIRLLCIRLSKTHGSVMAERCWRLGERAHFHSESKSCPLYNRQGFRDVGPCLATFRCRWLAWQDNKAELDKHLETCQRQFLMFNRKQSAARTMLFPLYHAVVRAYTAQNKDVDTAIFYLRRLVRLPGARQDTPQMVRTVDGIMNKLLAGDRALRGATLMNELRSYRSSGHHEDNDGGNEAGEDDESDHLTGRKAETSWWPAL